MTAFLAAPVDAPFVTILSIVVLAIVFWSIAK